MVCVCVYSWERWSVVRLLPTHFDVEESYVILDCWRRVVLYIYYILYIYMYVCTEFVIQREKASHHNFVLKLVYNTSRWNGYFMNMGSFRLPSKARLTWFCFVVHRRKNKNDECIHNLKHALYSQWISHSHVTKVCIHIYIMFRWNIHKPKACVPKIKGNQMMACVTPEISLSRSADAGLSPYILKKVMTGIRFYWEGVFYIYGVAHSWGAFMYYAAFKPG